MTKKKVNYSGKEKLSVAVDHITRLYLLRVAREHDTTIDHAVDIVVGELSMIEEKQARNV